MSWLKLLIREIRNAETLGSQWEIWYRGAEIVVNAAMIRAIKKRPDGLLAINIDGATITAEVLAEWPTFPHDYLVMQA